MNKGAVVVVAGSPTAEVVEGRLQIGQDHMVVHPSRLAAKASQGTRCPHPYYYYVSKLTFLGDEDSLISALFSNN